MSAPMLKTPMMGTPMRGHQRVVLELGTRRTNPEGRTSKGRSLAGRFARAAEGASAVEFALVLPVLMTIYFGGYLVCEVAAAYRKVTLTAHTVADLTTQYTSMSATDVANVIGASTQVMAPFATTNLTIVLSEFQVTAAGVATVTWSQALNATPLRVGTPITLPPGVAQPATSIVLASVGYSYLPVVGYKLTGPIAMSSQLYMSPRQVGSITYTGS